MSETWVVNASPVISLAKIGQLHRLTDLAAVLIPIAVVNELVAGPENDPARIAVSTGFAIQGSPSSIPPSVLEWGLGAGETQVLAMALEVPDAVVVLDDAAARAAARTLNLPMIGTLAVVIRAKIKGLIPAAAPLITSLLQAGLRLNDSVIAPALGSIGESWPVQPTS